MDATASWWWATRWGRGGTGRRTRRASRPAPDLPAGVVRLELDAELLLARPPGSYGQRRSAAAACSGCSSPPGLDPPDTHVEWIILMGASCHTTLAPWPLGADSLRSRPATVCRRRRQARWVLRARGLAAAVHRTMTSTSRCSPARTPPTASDLDRAGVADSPVPNRPQPNRARPSTREQRVSMPLLVRRTRRWSLRLTFQAFSRRSERHLVGCPGRQWRPTIRHVAPLVGVPVRDGASTRSASSVCWCSTSHSPLAARR